MEPASRLRLAPFASLVSLAAVAAACSASVDPDDAVLDPAEATSALAAAAPCAADTVPERSLAVTDRETLARFSLSRVFDRLRATAQVRDRNPAMWARWMATFADTASGGSCDAPDVDPNDYGLVCPRAPEAALGAVDPFAADPAVARFVPVAVFNRFDLTPTSGANCGEYRIVYALTRRSGRAFVIFEAVLPNPEPDAGVDACLPVATFWQQLSREPDPVSRAAKLEAFYFTGGAVPGFPAVVKAAHYGLADGAVAHGAGQVRTNFFADNREWQLREFKLQRTCTNAANLASCRLDFDHVPAKANPAEELFAGRHRRSAAFRTAFAKQVKALARPDVAAIGLRTADAFNEHESVSSRRDVVYVDRADETLRTAVRTELAALGSTLTAEDVLNRATTQTCAGCHEVANGLPLGGGLSWPSSSKFVHVDETGQLSQALTEVFLPARRRALEAFVNARCGGKSAPALEPGLTVAGGVEGAAN